MPTIIQKNAGANNVLIGDAGSGNTYHVSQADAAKPEFAQMQLEPASVRRFQRSELRKERRHHWAKNALAIFAAVIAVVADVYGATDKLGFSAKWLFFPLMVLLALWAWQHVRAERILSRLPKQGKDSAAYIGGNEVVQNGSEDEVLVFSLQARCTYPHCEGHIQLHDAPPREIAKLGRTYVGVCSVCGKDHSYSLDRNWTARPRDFDWRPLDKDGRG